VSQVIKETFTTPAADADLKAYNDEFIKKHAESASHLQAAYSARYALDNTTKSQNETDLIKTLDLSNITSEQAQQGLALLGEWKSDEKVQDEYRNKASSKWSEASVFKK
jgi:hypothetical protein